MYLCRNCFRKFVVPFRRSTTTLHQLSESQISSNEFSTQTTDLDHPNLDLNFEMAKKAKLKNKLSKTIRKMRLNNTDPEIIKVKVAELESVSENVNTAKLNLEEDLSFRPKGTRDFGPAEMVLREDVMSQVVKIFKGHGAVPTDTPIFELTKVLNEKYGDEEHARNFIYDLQNDGGEMLSLRYDLTVPFARYLSTNKLRNMKRYQIGKVYRKEIQYSLIRGMYREFYQCDFDIAGRYDRMLPEAECLQVVHQIMDKLNLPNFTIKINHRNLLYAVLGGSGVPVERFKKVSSLIDYLDKRSWNEIRQSLADECLLEESVLDSLEHFVTIREQMPSISNWELLKLLKNDSRLNEKESFVSAVEDVELLLKYTSIFGMEEHTVLDLTLARGLDYYTGVIYEVVAKEFAVSNNLEDGVRIGSVAAGGRYDDLVGMFNSNKMSVPCVGISVGIDRILGILERRIEKKDSVMAVAETQIYVCTPHHGLTEEKLRLVKLLWDGGLKVETALRSDTSILKQFQHCEAYSVPLAVIIGQDEINQGGVKLRHVPSRTEEFVPREDIVTAIKTRLNSLGYSVV